MRYEVIHLNGFMYAVDKSIGLIHPDKDGYYQIEGQSKIWEYSKLKRGWYTLDDIPCTIVGTMRVYPVIATTNPSLNLPLLPAIEEDITKIATDYVMDNQWGHPVDDAGNFMYDEVKKAFIDGYKAAQAKKWSDEDVETMITDSIWIWNDKGCTIKEAIAEVLKKVQPKIKSVEIETENGAVCKVCNNQGLRHCAHPEECGESVDIQIPVTYQKDGKTYLKVKEVKYG